MIERFRELNGAEWRGTRGPDPEINAGCRSVDSARQERPVGKTLDPLDKERVRGFVRRNAELLSITDAEVAALEIGPHGGFIRMYTVRGIFPRCGYEKFPSVARAVRLNIMLAEDGSVVFYQNPSPCLPPFEICTKTRLKPEAPELRRELVDRAFTFGDFGGQLRSSRPIELDDLRAPELTLFEWGRNKEAVITLAYVMRVHLPMPWDVFVDADEGHFLGHKQLFAT